ncbi:DNA-binding transcriptional LysR family regulator [Geomicrobium halophilum]|uniref:DNA-binding transcriptional LysR family regulator n=1 Tax=Geomicrobium halophilum TaxID=549000 RepID=A0A841PWN1_9BACL|nr:LysR family transcriptional regulator [Geomicrobium halophilum]MBB6448275.1 DNA-binding transcriptional LysR family regulator [Geomicrobium halophilum]
MDIRQLQYFTEVAKRLSFTKAAAYLHVSQPSLSKAIKHLEEELDVPLFYRSSKQLQLTDAGKAVLTNTKQVLDSFYQLTTELSDIMNLEKGVIKIGIPPIIGAAFFSSLITQFKERYPGVDLRLTEVGSNRIQQRIEDGSLDVGFICNIPHQKDHFEMLKFLEDPLVLVAHNDHPLSKRQDIGVSELEHERMVFYHSDFSLHDSIIEECLKNGFYPQVVCESSQKDFMLEMIAAKLGVGLLPSQVANEIPKPTLTTVPLTGDPIKLNLGVIWKKNVYQSFAARAFIETSEKCFHEPLG